MPEFRRERAPSLRYHRRLPTKGCLMPEPSVRFRGVNKSFGRAGVLRGIDLDVHSGECVGLAGVNGAGKTTLIKCLLDFCDLDSGAIEIHGTTHRRPQSRARLAFLPERFIALLFRPRRGSTPIPFPALPFSTAKRAVSVR